MGLEVPAVPRAASVDEPAAPPTQIRYVVLAAACVVAVIVYVHRVGFARALPELNLTAEQEGWLQAMFLLAYGGFEIPAGLLGDRWGVRHLLTMLVLGWSLATGCVALVVFLPDVWMLPFAFLLVIRFLFGMFQAGAFPSISRMTTDWVPVGGRASAQGLIWMSTRLGGMIITPLVGWLIVLCGSWEMPLWILAALGVVWCAAFWPWFRNRPEDMPRVNAAERALITAGRGPAVGHGSIPWRRMLRSRSIWALCLMYGFGGFAANFFVTLLPTYLKKYCHLQLTTDEVDWIPSFPFAFGLVACLGGGLLSDWIIRRTGNRKRGRRLQGSIALIVGGLGWWSLNFAGTAWVLGALLCLIFFCNDLSMGPAWASCADIGERYAATLGGAMNMVGNLTGVAGNLLAGYLFGAGHAESVFWIYGCSFGLAAICWMCVDVTQRLEASAQA
jgi:MFS family permease